jgi:hypothetical protein
MVHLSGSLGGDRGENKQCTLDVLSPHRGLPLGMLLLSSNFQCWAVRIINSGSG